MSKQLLYIVGGVVLSLSTVGPSLAQSNPSTQPNSSGQSAQSNQSTQNNNPPTAPQSGQSTPSNQTAQPTQTTTITITQSAQNPRGVWSVVEYPPGREVDVKLVPTTVNQSARGMAHVVRSGNHTSISLDLSGLTGDGTYTLHAIDPSGKATALGSVTINNGSATQAFTTPLNKFMLVVSPEPNLSSYGPDSSVVLRSIVPAGMAIVPMMVSKPKTSAEHVSATTVSSPTPAYSAPMLNVPAFKVNAWNRVRVNFSRPLTGAMAMILIRPRRDQTTEVHANFHNLRRAVLPAGTRLVLWAVAPDKALTKLGQVVYTGNRNRADLHSETGMKDFGLFVTTESGPESSQPAGATLATGATTP